MQPAMTSSEMQYHAMGEVSSPRNYQEFSPPVETGPLSRKRTYSVFEGLPSASFTHPSFTSRPNALGLFPLILFFGNADWSRRASPI